jgi:predicted TIM-barrel fold metal-dependent hydrolase
LREVPVAAIPFVDTHFHLHDLKHPTLRWSWLERDAIHPSLGDIDAIKAQHYWIQDYIAETRFSNVTKAIHVQAALGSADPVEETKWLQAFADQFGFPQGIVAECHLAQADAQSVLERHVEYANVRGIRELVGPETLADPNWVRGFRLLPRFKLVPCVSTTYEHLSKVSRLAEQIADAPLCIEHCAFPMARSKEYFDAWREGVRELGKSQNVHVKISGLGMFDRAWTVESFRPWVLECIEAFSPARVMFGTNWPLDRLSSSFPDLIDAYDRIVSGFMEADRRAMFAGNAERVFRI